ncbi:hypothetical protein CJU89_6848 [Yarrowia sp. B02]|nr:hypothetical protein CJU89_6848 [Yarrowia sp. B02]
MTSACSSAMPSALPSGMATPFFHGLSMTPLDHHTHFAAQLSSASKKLDTRRDFVDVLPTEVCHAIFSCLTFDDLVSSHQVSHSWKNIISGSGDLWRESGIHMDRRTPLNELALQKYVSYALEGSSKPLSHLQLHRNYVAEIPAVGSIFDFAHRLQSFSGHLKMTNADAKKLFSKMTELKHLDLVVSGEVLELSVFWSSEKLETLRLGYRGFPEVSEDVSESAELPKTSNLKYLSIDGLYDSPISSSDLRKTVMASAASLEYLSVKNCVYSSQPALSEHTLDKIKLPNLSALIYNLGESILPNIMCPKLKHLDLSRFEGCEDAIPLRRIWGFPNVETVVFNQSIQIADVMEDVLYFGRMKSLKTLTCMPCPVNGEENVGNWKTLLKTYSPELSAINV